MTKIIAAEHPLRGRLWAAIDPAAHHVTGSIAERRFAAFLSPYRSVAEAEAALKASGAKLTETVGGALAEHGRKGRSS